MKNFKIVIPCLILSGMALHCSGAFGHPDKPGQSKVNGNNQWVRKGSIQYWNDGATTANSLTGVQSITALSSHQVRADGQVTGGAGEYGIKFNPTEVKGYTKAVEEQYKIGWRAFGSVTEYIAGIDQGQSIQAAATGRLRFKKANGEFILLVDPHDFYTIVDENSSNVEITIPIGLPIKGMPPFAKLHFKPPAVGTVKQFYPRDYSKNGKQSKIGEKRIFYLPTNLIVGDNSPLEILRPIQGQVFTYGFIPSWASHVKAEADLTWYLKDAYTQAPQSYNHPYDPFSSFVFGNPKEVYN